MHRLRILAGPSFSSLTKISANAASGFPIRTDAFEGEVAIFLKGFADTDGKVGESNYFDAEEREGVTWSVQVQVRREAIPWGFTAVTSFMQYLDPTLEQDLTSPTPWALSPFITTMPYFEHTRLNSEEEKVEAKTFPPPKPVGENVSALRFTRDDPEIEGGVNRKTYFQSAAHRKTVEFGPQDVITADFCWGYLNFTPDGISARIPGGFTLDLMKYWDGLPVRFVCCERIPKGELVDGKPWGKVLWCLAIEAVDKEGLPNAQEAKKDETTGAPTTEATEKGQKQKETPPA
ncbi:hypothetical protein EUX98_g7649 [Antrodiella citrinella]|uniref:Domain of unknown function at the cortex 1 domain-containing protein n=1 Tax=Antrodiella citrinella TaxID=2447956 RepID=A0A4S4MLB4_9APHY|nr:hypothetical protein EUX98_g7649 [Antrodiella citrinella]